MRPLPPPPIRWDDDGTGDDDSGAREEVDVPTRPSKTYYVDTHAMNIPGFGKGSRFKKREKAQAARVGIVFTYGCKDGTGASTRIREWDGEATVKESGTGQVSLPQHLRSVGNGYSADEVAQFLRKPRRVDPLCEGIYAGSTFALREIAIAELCCEVENNNGIDVNRNRQLLAQSVSPWLNARAPYWAEEIGLPREEGRDAAQTIWIDWMAKYFGPKGRYRFLGAGDIPASLRSFVEGKLKNAAKGAPNRKKRPDQVIAVSGADGDPPSHTERKESREIRSEHQVSDAELRLAMLDCMERLPPRKRECLVLYLVQEKTYAEIGECYRRSHTTAKNWCSEALRDLALCLRQKGFKEAVLGLGT
jgi:RNA polymerase sigma factor (sigma-70 family)